jgi:hypothetical protein
MPGFDRTGPEGKGPMTGGARGRCRGRRGTPNDPDEENATTPEAAPEARDEENVDETEQTLGIGRGGRPRGGGRGHCWGGGQGRGRRAGRGQGRRGRQ